MAHLPSLFDFHAERTKEQLHPRARRGSRTNVQARVAILHNGGRQGLAGHQDQFTAESAKNAESGEMFGLTFCRFLFSAFFAFSAVILWTRIPRVKSSFEWDGPVRSSAAGTNLGCKPTGRAVTENPVILPHVPRERGSATDL